MPRFTAKRCSISGPWQKLLGIGPVLGVSLKLPASVAQLSGNATTTQALALVDTGASITAISADIAAQLGLQPADKIPVQGPHGLKLCNVYSVDFSFDGSNFWIPNKWVCEMVDPLVGSIAMLIGRDVLRNTYFTYDGYTGICTIDIPSISHPDHPANPANRPASQTKQTDSDKARQQQHKKEQARRRRVLGNTSRRGNR